MEKIRSREEAEYRLKETEREINRHFEALQGEIKQTKQDMIAYVSNNPLLGLAGATLSGILVGLLIGKKSQRAKHKEMFDTYVERFAKTARRSGASEGEVVGLLQDVLKETIPQVVYSVPDKKPSSLKRRVFGLVVDIAFMYVTRLMVNSLEAQFSSGNEESDPEETNESELS